MIRVRGLTKQFDNHRAVEDVSFEVAEGETLVLLGTSGSGKTTTMRMINRLLEPTAGSIDVRGSDIRQRNPIELRREIGYVLQDSALFPHYTVADNIAVVPRLLGWPKNRTHERTLALLATLRLPESLLGQYPDQLSGGQRQRVGLARALAANPPIVLMDEPLGALDPITRLSIRKEFRQLPELKAKTVILVTHDVLEAFELGDRIGIMDGGRLQQVGTPGELLQRPANAFVAQFLADQRLSLQFRVYRMAEVMPYFAVELTNEVSAGESGVSVADALEQLAKQVEYRVPGENGGGREITQADVLIAFGKMLAAKGLV